MQTSLQLKHLISAAIISAFCFASPITVYGQCSSGNCGNVGVADQFGGYGSVGYGAAGNLSSTSGSQWGHRHSPPLFDNYFTQGNANRADAALYISPVGVPGWVGHTYNTYQPLYPHQFLYHHTDKYHSYYDEFSLNRTKAKCVAPPARTAIQSVRRHIELPR